MREQSHHRSLEALAEQESVSQPLARLQLEALRVSADPQWAANALQLSSEAPRNGVPLLHQQQIPVDLASIRSLLQRLVEILGSLEIVDDPSVQAGIREIDPSTLLEASLQWDAETLELLAERANVEPPILITLGHCSLLPVLLPYGNRYTSSGPEGGWEFGYCPVCGAWPLIAEQRGIERQQWLRCGRCSAGWRSRQQRCIFCDNTDHTKLGYMAPEEERESRRAVTCEVCHGYLKIFASVGPLDIGEILRHDLTSIELDIAALDNGYTRPGRGGFSIQASVDQAPSRIRRWLS